VQRLRSAGTTIRWSSRWSNALDIADHAMPQNALSSAAAPRGDPRR
jgi:hypothetical protein